MSQKFIAGAGCFADLYAGEHAQTIRAGGKNGCDFGWLRAPVDMDQGSRSQIAGAAPATPPTAADSCPTPSLIMRFRRRDLREGEAETLEAHVDDCVACCVLLLELALLDDEPPSIPG